MACSFPNTGPASCAGWLAPLACLPSVLASTYSWSSWANSFARGQLHSLQPCTKPCLQSESPNAKTKALIRRGMRCTKTAVYVQMFLDSARLVTHVGTMAGQKVVRVALYSRVSTKDKGQDVHNQTDQLREFCERLCQEDEKSSCCTKDGGRPSEAVLKEEASNCPKLLRF